MKNLKLGTSPINGTIYLGKTKLHPKMGEMWVGDKKDITNNAVAAVIEHLLHVPGKKVTMLDDTGTTGYTLTLKRKRIAPKRNIKK